VSPRVFLIDGDKPDIAPPVKMSKMDYSLGAERITRAMNREQLRAVPGALHQSISMAIIRKSVKTHTM